ncbi:glycosyl transferase [Arthrobacter stackebrandtii]|nr:glycosyl transferase [Arthrobacter stackebrandtii]
MSSNSLSAEIGQGALSRMTATTYRLIVLAAFLALMCAPTLVVWTLLGANSANIGFFVVALLPVGPALSAAIYGLRAWTAAPDLSPARALWRGYKLNFTDTMKWWTLVVAADTVLIVNIAFADSVPFASVLRPVGFVILVLLGVWSAHVLVAASLFSFRTRDSMRIAAVEVFSQWRVSLGFLALLVVAVGTVNLGSELALLLLAWAFMGILWLIAQPLITEITRRFITHD